LQVNNWLAAARNKTGVIKVPCHLKKISKTLRGKVPQIDQVLQNEE
jgi:hypothetical protein